MSVKYTLDDMLELIYPSHVACCVCGKETHFDGPPYICKDCSENIHFINGQRSFVVGSREMIVYYAFDYEDVIKNLIHDLKYEGKRYKAKSLSIYLNKVIELNDLKYDIITPVPLHPNRRKQRGYNQCAVLLREMDEKYNDRYKEILIRTRDTEMQSLIPTTKRHTNILDAFEVKEEIAGKNILLVDDIVTTGATMRENCKMLYNNGADNVIGLAIAT